MTFQIPNITFNVVEKYNQMLSYASIIGVAAVEGQHIPDTDMRDLETKCIYKTPTVRHDLWHWKGKLLIHGMLIIGEEIVTIKINELYGQH